MYSVAKGKPHPIGATPDKGGVNFSIYSENATSVELLLFEAHDHRTPCQTIRLFHDRNRTFFFWHIYVKGLKPGAHYAYRVDGPREPHRGHRFNPNKVLVDPYSRGITNALWQRQRAIDDRDNLDASLRSVVIDTSDYDWQGDRPLKLPIQDLVIYEMHVGGFTRSPTSGVKHPGTFAGVVEKIPYLRQLGVNAVELLPVFEFDETEVLRNGPDGRPLRNYWGYSTLNLFSPEGSFCISPEEGKHLAEFRDMVKALHRAGIEVILDVVFNHTNEGDHQGPTISLRGFDNRVYYHLDEDNPFHYKNYSGCGNTVNCNHPIVARLIYDALLFWIREMHVDGFRFDEGSILSRDEDGKPMKHPPLLWTLELAPWFVDTKLITEAWDAAGLYQLGTFPGHRWAEWNDRYRDTIRRFVRGDPGLVGSVANRIAGSADLFQSRGRSPINSINFVACHDGFTLRDLVSYNHKHNEANGEANRDGVDENYSSNYGVEGDSDDPHLVSFRKKQVKNFAVILMLSQGVPMILAGDEFGRTQGGNNNAYCQNNPTSWLDWGLCRKNEDLLRFFTEIIRFRKSHPLLKRDYFLTGEPSSRGFKDIEWHGCRLGAPGWNDEQSRVLAFTMGGIAGMEPDFHVMMNMDSMDLEFEIPSVNGNRHWHRIVDTDRPSPNDIGPIGQGPVHAESKYRVRNRSVVVLASR